MITMTTTRCRYHLYLSGPMTGMKDKNFPAFMQGAKKLRDRKHFVVNPAELDIGEPETTWAKCLQRDIRELMKCNGVATLPGWKKSRGANLEVYIAKALGWPVHPVAYWLKRRKR